MHGNRGQRALTRLADQADRRGDAKSVGQPIERIPGAVGKIEPTEKAFQQADARSKAGRYVAIDARRVGRRVKTGLLSAERPAAGPQQSDGPRNSSGASP